MVVGVTPSILCRAEAAMVITTSSTSRIRCMGKAAQPAVSLPISWMWCVWVLETTKVVVAPIANAVVAAAIKTKIDNFLTLVFMLTPEQRYSLYEIRLTLL